MSEPEVEVEGELAVWARMLLEAHAAAGWNTPHHFVSLLRNAGTGRLRAGTLTVIDPGVNPEDYPGLMFRAAAAEFEEGTVPYAYALQIESFDTPVLSASASAEERTRWEAARQNRTISQQDGAVESAWAWVTDVHGRSHGARQVRKTGEIEDFSVSISSDMRIGGRMAHALQACANVARMLM